MIITANFGSARSCALALAVSPLKIFEPGTDTGRHLAFLFGGEVGSSPEPVDPLAEKCDCLVTSLMPG
jgi:hypothetical protein